MNSNIRRTVTGLLALLTVSAMLAACGEAAEAPVSTDAVETGTVETELDISQLSEIEQRAYMKHDLPEKDFGAKEFRISTKDGTKYEFYTDAEDGDILNDALFARNRTIEERFNTVITPVITMDGSGNAQVNEIKTTLLAGDEAYELTASYVFTSGALVTEGLFQNWLDMPYTQLNKPWWINGVNENFRIGDAIFMAVGDTCVSTLKLTYAMFYNRTLGANYDISFDDIAKMVDNGTWTIDNFISMIHELYTDVNGDSKRDENDIYGFTAEKATNLDIYSFAFDIPMISKNADGMPEIVFNTAKTVDAVEKVNRLYWDGTGSFIPEDAGLPITVFKNGNALFCTTWLGQALSTYRDMDDQYSILPYPKYDEAQERYMTGAMDNYSVLGIPYNVKDTEFVSLITEALNIESYKTLFPTYYVEALQNKYARDESSIAMLDIIMQGRNFDLATLFSSQVNGLPWVFRNTVAKKSTDFASAYAKMEKGAIKGLTAVIAAYEENEG